MNLALDVVQRVPELSVQASCDGRTHARDLTLLLTDDVCADKIGLTLHHQIVHSHAAIDDHTVEVVAAVLDHGFHDFS